jgi:hypothetical protein
MCWSLQPPPIPGCDAVNAPAASPARRGAESADCLRCRNDSGGDACDGAACGSGRKKLALSAARAAAASLSIRSCGHGQVRRARSSLTAWDALAVRSEAFIPSRKHAKSIRSALTASSPRSAKRRRKPRRLTPRKIPQSDECGAGRGGERAGGRFPPVPPAPRRSLYG